MARDLGASQVWLGLYSPAGQQEFVWASSGLPEIGYMRVRTERFRKDEDLYTSVRVDQNSTFNMVQFRAGGAELSVVCEYDVPR